MSDPSGNTFDNLQQNIKRLQFLYDAYKKNGDTQTAKEARRLLKAMRRQFKGLYADMGVSRDEFEHMMQSDISDEPEET